MSVKHNRLFIISGCNGAGKTTASFNILPDILDCKEYVNADEIARGISPFQPEKVAVEAGRVMLRRMDELLDQRVSFAFETTLATRSFKQFISKAKRNSYRVTLIYFWLDSVELAKLRVQNRVAEGGHNIPEDVIERRYVRGLSNLFYLYADLCDLVLLYDNSKSEPELIFEKTANEKPEIYNPMKFEKILSLSK